MEINVVFSMYWWPTIRSKSFSFIFHAKQTGKQTRYRK